MPPRPKVDLLPEEIRMELESRLIQSGFGNYRGLSDWLASVGYQISKSSLQEWGEGYEQQLAALKVATDQARAIVAESPDDDGAMNEALMRLVQQKMFTAIRDLNVNPEKLNLNSLARSIAELSRASVTQKKYAQEVRERAQAAAESATKIAKRGGLSADSVKEIRAAILGIAA